MRCDLKVELTGGLAGLDVYDIKREALRLTVKYLAWITGTTDFPFIRTWTVKTVKEK